jgi:hypothetical protein
MLRAKTILCGRSAPRRLDNSTEQLAVSTTHKRKQPICQTKEKEEGESSGRHEMLDNDSPTNLACFNQTFNLQRTKRVKINIPPDNTRLCNSPIRSFRYTVALFPLPYKDVLRYRTRQNVGGISNLASNTKYTRECRPHFAACGTPDRAMDCTTVLQTLVTLLAALFFLLALVPVVRGAAGPRGYNGLPLARRRVLLREFTRKTLHRAQSPIARSGVAVTLLLCDPLPYKNVLKVSHAKHLGENTALAFSTKCTKRSPRFSRVRYSGSGYPEKLTPLKIRECERLALFGTFCTENASVG